MTTLLLYYFTTLHTLVLHYYTFTYFTTLLCINVSPGEEAAERVLILLTHICFVDQQSKNPYLATR
jgi:hypothetical protein